jgi:hypothetical protein
MLGGNEYGTAQLGMSVTPSFGGLFLSLKRHLVCHYTQYLSRLPKVYCQT